MNCISFLACEFRCGLTNDSNCVSKESVCDGYPHCPNGEDEFGCGKYIS